MNFKKIFNKDFLNKEFFKKYQRYCYAVVAGIALVLLLIFGTTTNKEPEKKAEGFSTDQEFEIDEYSEVNDLLAAYYEAYATSDIEALKEIATPISENEASYIGVFNQFTDEITNVKVYTMHGPEEDSFFVSACYEIKFVDVETLSPSLDFFYIQKDEEGKYFINNLYSTYNYSHQDEPLDTEVCNAIQQYAAMDCVKNLKAEVQTKYNEAIANDESLSNLIQITLRNEIHLWAESITTAEEEETEDTQQTEVTEQTSEVETQKPEENSEPEAPKEVKVKVTIKKVNVRKSASENGDKLGKAYKDNTYKKLGTEGDWTKIDYDGKTGYIASKYLEEVQ